MIDHLKVFDEYSVPVSGAFGANINVLPQVREAIETGFPSNDWQWQEPYIAAVEIWAASAFTVSLNSLTTLTAQPENSAYVVRFEGTIDRMVFEASTTPTALKVAWGPDRKNHYLATLTGVSGTTFTLENAKGETIVPTATANTYDLTEGWYNVTAQAAGYETLTKAIYYMGGSAVNLEPYQQVAAED